MERKPVASLTREEFRALHYYIPPIMHHQFFIGHNLIVVPDDDGIPVHDSGYRNMSLVIVLDDERVIRLQGYSDVLHIDGIGRQGLITGSGTILPLKNAAWSIDCLAESGFFRLFNSGGHVAIDTMSLSSACFVAVNKEDFPITSAVHVPGVLVRRGEILLPYVEYKNKSTYLQ